MDRKKIAKALAKELWKQPSMLKSEMEEVILNKLTDLLNIKHCEMCQLEFKGDGSVCSDRCADLWIATYLP